MDKIMQMIKEICLQDPDLELIRLEHIPADYDPIDDILTSEMVVASIDAKYKAHIYAMLGDFATNFHSIITNITIYNMDNMEHACIEIMKLE